MLAVTLITRQAVFRKLHYKLTKVKRQGISELLWK
jgi:hypothetical protein